MLTERQRRLGELFRAEISEILLREVRDPGLRGLVTLTGVRVAADLSVAVVFVSVYGQEQDAEDTLAALDRSAPFMRALLRERLDLRRIPELLFQLDDTPARAQRIEETLRHLHEQEGTGSSGEDALSPAEAAEDEGEEGEEDTPGSEVPDLPLPD